MNIISIFWLSVDLLEGKGLPGCTRGLAGVVEPGLPISVAFLGIRRLKVNSGGARVLGGFVRRLFQPGGRRRGGFARTVIRCCTLAAGGCPGDR